MYLTYYEDGRALPLFNLRLWTAFMGNKNQLTVTTSPTKSALIREILKYLESVIQNQVLVGEFILKPVGEKTRGIASLQRRHSL